MTTLEAFRVVAPEFAAKTDAQVNAVIEFVSPMVSEARFGKLYPHALAYLAAHWLAWQALIAAGNDGSGSGTASTGGALTGGKIVSEKEGDLARSYADTSSKNTAGSSSYTDNLERTAYGLEYKRIARLVITPILTRMG